MEKIKQLFEKFEIDVHQGKERAVNELREKLTGQISSEKIEALLVHVDEYFESLEGITQEEIVVELSEENERVEEVSEIHEDIIVTEAAPIDEPEEATAETIEEEELMEVKATSSPSMSINEMYRDHNKNNQMNKYWFAYIFVLVIASYITGTKYFEASISSTHAPGIIFTVLMVVLGFVGVGAYYFDSKEYKERKLSVSRIIFILTVGLFVVGALLGYDAKEWSIDTTKRAIISIVFLRSSTIMSLFALVSLYFSAFKNHEFTFESKTVINPAVSTETEE